MKYVRYICLNKLNDILPKLIDKVVHMKEHCCKSYFSDYSLHFQHTAVRKMHELVATGRKQLPKSNI